jgi:geranylgeranyl reductase family protein
LVLERKAVPGENTCCTGIVSRQCVEEFEIGRDLIFRPASSATLFSPSGKTMKFQRDEEVAYILDRTAFDRGLADRARSAGAEYLFRQNVTEIVIESDRVSLRTVGGREGTAFTAQAVVLATGFGSALPGRLGLSQTDDIVIGAQARVETNNLTEVELFFDRALAPDGFAWLVPTGDNQGLAGMLTRRDPQAHMSLLLARLEELGKITTRKVSADYAVIPIHPMSHSAVDRLLVLGEAAGQIKPTTAGGIYYGMHCADIAADTLHRALQTGDLSKDSLGEYERRWRTELIRELRAGRWLVRLFCMMNNQWLEWLFRYMNFRRLPDYIAGMEDLPFDRHASLAARLFPYLLLPILDKRNKG